MRRRRSIRCFFRLHDWVYILPFSTLVEYEGQFWYPVGVVEVCRRCGLLPSGTLLIPPKHGPVVTVDNRRG
ncbi:MAG: hypothetical protein PHV57_07170 [Methanomicrobiaceae archaeon]|nr:hypothetical protein [Methanomicrobiaceae archaeon]